MINTAVILAAGMGVRLQGLVKDVPKGFIQVNGKTLVELSVEKLKKNGIEKIVVVTGHLSEVYDKFSKAHEGIITINNDVFATSGSMYSLYLARPLLADCTEGFLLLESDLLYEERAIVALLNHQKENSILISGFTKSGDEVWIESNNGKLVNMSKNALDLKSTSGELVGISKISKEMYDKMVCNAEKMFEETLKVEYEHCIVRTSRDVPVYTCMVEDLAWTEIDDSNHMKRAIEEVAPKVFK